MHDIRWKGLGVAHTYTFNFYLEKHDGGTAGLSKLESPGTGVLTQVKTARNVKIY